MLEEEAAGGGSTAEEGQRTLGRKQEVGRRRGGARRRGPLRRRRRASQEPEQTAARQAAPEVQEWAYAVWCAPGRTGQRTSLSPGDQRGRRRTPGRATAADDRRAAQPGSSRPELPEDRPPRERPPPAPAAPATAGGGSGGFGAPGAGGRRTQGQMIEDLSAQVSVGLCAGLDAGLSCARGPHRRCLWPARAGGRGLDPRARTRRRSASGRWQRRGHARHLRGAPGRDGRQFHTPGAAAGPAQGAGRWRSRPTRGRHMCPGVGCLHRRQHRRRVPGRPRRRRRARERRRLGESGRRHSVLPRRRAGAVATGSLEPGHRP